jgi:hypothetical protein
MTDAKQHPASELPEGFLSTPLGDTHEKWKTTLRRSRSHHRRDIARQYMASANAPSWGELRRVVATRQVEAVVAGLTEVGVSDNSQPVSGRSDSLEGSED